MNSQIDALKARFLVVSVLFLASACVIQSAAEQPNDEEAVQPAPTVPAAQTEKAETAVAKAPAAKPAAAAKPAPKVAAAKAAKPAKAVKTATAPASAAVTASASAPTSAPAKLMRVSRYVSVDNLNVRSRADQNAPIVGRLARGSMITVSVDGDWAKIGDTQFVAVRHLSKQQPQAKRLVSRK